MKEPVAIYARYSTQEQDARSLEDQVRRCRRFAEMHGMHVVKVYEDAAKSGASMFRDGLQSLLTDARRRGGSPFSAVLVDDLSRLARDLLDMGEIVFRELPAFNVRVVDVMTGLSSNMPAARQSFFAVGMGNDMFLQMVRHETHRGLEGRHEKGFWTGGRVYGYRTVPEPNPPDPEHPRKVPVIDPGEAEVVRRIFNEYAAGRGYANIARGLNDSGIAAPYDGLMKKKWGNGWAPSSIRALLLNERYIGLFVWNKREHFRVPGKKSRRVRQRPESEWKRDDRPDLAIIDRALWDSVQAKLKEQSRRGAGRPVGSEVRQVRLLSGIARCGVCGASFGVVGGRKKNGVHYVTMGCTARWNRGPSICSNSTTISERKLNTAILGAIGAALSAPDIVERITMRVDERVATQQPVSPAEELEKKIAATSEAIRRLTDGVARMGYSDALGERLRAEESLLAGLKREQAAAKQAAQPRKPPPEAGAIAKYVRGLLATLEKDPQRAKDLLRAHLSEGLELVPKDEGPDRRYYLAKGAFDLSEIPTNGNCSSFSFAGARWERFLRPGSPWRWCSRPGAASSAARVSTSCSLGHGGLRGALGRPFPGGRWSSSTKAPRLHELVVLVHEREGLPGARRHRDQREALDHCCIGHQRRPLPRSAFPR